MTATSWLIDHSYPPDLSDELVDRRRIDKLVEEIGEVHEAYNGWLGENPRKGVCDTKEHVLEELLDVAASALGTYEHLTGHSGDAHLGCWTHEELRLAYNEAPKPNVYGDELLRRAHARDRAELGMGADNPALR